MPDVHRQYQQNFILDLIENAVIASSKAIKIGYAFELFHPNRARITSQGLNLAGYPLLHVWRQIAQAAHCCWF